VGYVEFIPDVTLAFEQCFDAFGRDVEGGAGRLEQVFDNPRPVSA